MLLHEILDSSTLRHCLRFIAFSHLFASTSVDNHFFFHFDLLVHQFTSRVESFHHPFHFTCDDLLIRVEVCRIELGIIARDLSGLRLPRLLIAFHLPSEGTDIRTQEILEQRVTVEL